MTTWVHFAPELGAWIADNLDRGAGPAALIATLVEKGMASNPAQTIVEAHVAARADGVPPPVDTVALAEAEAGYECEPMRLAATTAIDTPDRRVRIVARAERPALAVLGDLLDAAECAELIELARGRLQPSTVVDPRTGLDVANGQRGSRGMFFRPGENAFIARLERRIAAVTNVPIAHGEGLQVLHYPLGAGSAPHFDFLVPSNAANRDSIARSGQRLSTLVAYLNDVPAGGQTVFPQAGWAVAPQQGNALYFEYCNRAGHVDPASLHASEPVVAGEKWVATKWVRQRPFVSRSSA